MRKRARGCTASPVDMLRSRAQCCICLATRGRYSLIWMPGTDVGIALYSLSGLRSKVWDWLGPPFIQRRMQDLGFWPVEATWAALEPRVLNQPEVEVARTPAAERRIQSRRERVGCFSGILLLLQ